MPKRKCVKGYRPLQHRSSVTRFRQVENQSRNHALRKRTQISICKYILFYFANIFFDQISIAIYFIILASEFERAFGKANYRVLTCLVLYE